MSNLDRAGILRRHLDALASELSELENLRDRVLKAEQRRLGRARQRALGKTRGDRGRVSRACRRS